MTVTAQKENIRNFIAAWKNCSPESDWQGFWLAMLSEVFSVGDARSKIAFQRFSGDGFSAFDGALLAESGVLIMQLSHDASIYQETPQPDGSLLTPFQQLLRYRAAMPSAQRPRHLVVSNIREFLICDMQKPVIEPQTLLLKELTAQYRRLEFLVREPQPHLHDETEASLRAGERIGRLYDALLGQCAAPVDAQTLKTLNLLCVRLVFCLYADDSGLFGERGSFRNYLAGAQTRCPDLTQPLEELFACLNTPCAQRSGISEELMRFPYVNGGLFARKLTLPHVSADVVELLLENTDESFRWSEISPTIFGAVFESTLNPNTRRSGGMHYTSVENIHKVIDPLFLDGLREELAHIRVLRSDRTRDARLERFREKLASLTFLDPACGSGNFLTETYISLRRLENEALALISGDQIMLGFDDLVKVSIEQFYGIEINDFAVVVAKAALWIAEEQMLRETEDIVSAGLAFLPLRSCANIVEGNALTLDWNDVIPRERLNYIMGNPPFIGAMMMSREQKAEMLRVLEKVHGVGELDYVAAWYYKAAAMMRGTDVRAAFVSTNSICQGQQAVTLWKPLFESGIRIRFAHRSFIWDSDAKVKAHVHCVIVGFAAFDEHPKYIYDNGSARRAENINPYLSDAPDVFVESRTAPICDVPEMHFGSMPRDDGGLILSDEQREQLLSEYPQARQWIRPYLGAYEFINRKTRWCLWLKDVDENEYLQCAPIVERLQHVRNFRAASIAAGTRKFAQTPALFCQIAQPDTDYIAVPKTSSQRRRYVPIGFLDSKTVASDAMFLIPDVTLYHFGVLTSSLHNAWMRVVCGRLKSDYRYAKDIVYNNFLWCDGNEEQVLAVEQTARGILEARALYPERSLAELYDEVTMPAPLRKAHRDNDAAVLALYGLDAAENEERWVAELLRRLQAVLEKDKQ